MSTGTQYVEGATRQSYGPETGQRSVVSRDTAGGEKPFFLTSEFLTMIGVIAALAIAGAVADNFFSPTVWTLITIVAAAYIVSRGLSKIGSGR